AAAWPTVSKALLHACRRRCGPLDPLPRFFLAVADDVAESRMKSRRSRRLLMLLILALGALALGVAYRLASQPAMTSGPLPHDVYIWQRRWSPPVHESL